MKRPQHFERLVVCCMSGILVTVWCIGALGYLAFGNNVEVRACVHGSGSTGVWNV